MIPSTDCVFKQEEKNSGRSKWSVWLKAVRNNSISVGKGDTVMDRSSPLENDKIKKDLELIRKSIHCITVIR